MILGVWVCEAATQASPVLVRFRMWPLFVHTEMEVNRLLTEKVQSAFWLAQSREALRKASVC